MTYCNVCPLKSTLTNCSTSPDAPCCALRLLHFLSVDCSDPLKFLQDIRPSLIALKKEAPQLSR